MRCSLLLLALCALAAAEIVNQDVSRTFDLQNHTPRVSLKITASGSGDYFLAFPAEAASRIAHIEATVDNEPVEVTVASPPDAKKDTAYFRLKLSGSKTTFEVEYVLTHSLHPLPAKIGQSDSQKVVFEGNHFFYSPYKTETQRTELKLASSSIESHSEEKPTSVRGKEIVYGPYSNKPAFSSSPLRVHYENNSPFFAATSLLKEVEVSFWGNVAVEEHYDIRHTGAELKGFFSRLDMQRSQTGNAPACIRQFVAELPVGASDVYYRDVIGNISSSHLREEDDGPNFEIIPRFPLFGGWKVQFYFGYNLPLHQYLFSDDNGRFHLNVTFGSPIKDVVVDDLTLKIILPEGSSNFAVNAPFAIGEQSRETRFTYLDRIGRPVIVLHKRNVVSDHDVHFQVSFDFASTYKLHEPFLLIVGFFAIFVLCIIRSRFFESSDKLQDLIAEFRAIHFAREDVRHQMDRLWSSFENGNIDSASYKEQLKALNAKLGEHAERAKEVEGQAETLGPEAAAFVLDVRQAVKLEASLDDDRHRAFAAATPEKPVSVSSFASRADAIVRLINKH